MGTGAWGQGQGGTKTNNRRGQCTHVASGALRLLLSFLPLNWSPKELRRHKRFSGLSGLTPHDGLLIPLKPPQLFRAQWPIVRDDWGSTCTQSHAEHARTILSSKPELGQCGKSNNRPQLGMADYLAYLRYIHVKGPMIIMNIFNSEAKFLDASAFVW